MPSTDFDLSITEKKRTNRGMYLVVDKACQKLPSKFCVVDIIERQDCGVVTRHVCVLFRKSIYNCMCMSGLVVLRCISDCNYGRGRGVTVQVT